jgi:hypothetical protein
VQNRPLIAIRVAKSVTNQQKSWEIVSKIKRNVLKRLKTTTHYKAK